MTEKDSGEISISFLLQDMRKGRNFLKSDQKKILATKDKNFFIGKNRVESNPNKRGIYIKQRLV